MRIHPTIRRCVIIMFAVILAGAPARAMGGDAQDDERARAALRNIESAIAARNVDALSRYFTSKVYLTLFTGENSWYSADQSYFILRNFFSSYTPLSLTLAPSGAATGSPYGVGTLLYVARGRRGSAQVFVALVRTESGDYKLNQLTIATR